MKNTISAADVKARAAGQWPDIIADIGGIDRQLLNGTHHPCPKCGGTDRFRFIDEQAGAVLCNRCFNEKNGDGFAALQWLTGKPFPEVMKLVGQHLGMTPAKSNGRPRNGQASGQKKLSGAALEEFLTSQFVPIKVAERGFRRWLDSKRPITLEAVNAAGCKTVQWPKNAPPGRGHRCLAVPFRDAAGHVSAVQLYRLDGSPFPAFKTVAERKIHTLRGSRNGWLVPGGQERLKSASVVWRVEGPSDALALHSLLPDDHVVVTSACGAGSVHGLAFGQFKGKSIRVVGDADNPGQEGAAKFAAAFRSVSSNVCIVQLPGEITGNHGKDIRDYLIDGGTFEQLQRLAEKSEPVPKPAVGDAKNDPVPIRNFDLVTEDDGGQPKVTPLPMADIIDAIKQRTGGQPFRVGNGLFSHETGRIEWIVNTSSFFAFVGAKAGVPAEFRRSPCVHGKQEVFEGWKRQATEFEAVETMPHEPPMAGHFYACSIPPAGDGAVLDELVNRFCPDEPVDREFIRAAIVSPLWGGPGGARPMFAVTSSDGRGVGKSALSSIVGHVYGGVIDVSPQEDIEKIKQRILTPSALPIRVVTFDNIKSLKWSSGPIEALITAPRISGRQMYTGEASRPNVLTYIATLNGPALSKDLAQRSVIIRLRRPKYAGLWEDNVREYIDQNRQELIGDIIGFLRSKQTPLKKYSRWGRWERDVLERLADPEAAQKTILVRQGEVDVEREESELIEDHFRQQLDELLLSWNAVFIPSVVAAEWYGQATGVRHTTAGASRTLKQLIDEGQMRHLTVCPNRNHGRGFIWFEPEWRPDDLIFYELQARLGELSRGRFSI